jgi:HPt (histidine-containing phosphotransfer) domain-containing protein
VIFELPYNVLQVESLKEIVMEIPAENRKIYLERRKSDLQLCMEYLEKKDFKELARVGHQLKGNASTFGFPELAKIGKSLEISAKENDHSSSTKLVQEISVWIKKLS